jgi:hypothetical protein
MIVEELSVAAKDVAARTGWEAKPEGLCKGDVCVPLPGGTPPDGRLSVEMLAERLRMPLVHDEEHHLWALGPESGGRALTTAVVPDITLPDRNGAPFALSSLRGQKVLLVAWASW